MSTNRRGRFFAYGNEAGGINEWWAAFGDLAKKLVYEGSTASIIIIHRVPKKKSGEMTGRFGSDFFFGWFNRLL
jgi:hypothetical protein